MIGIVIVDGDGWPDGINGEGDGIIGIGIIVIGVAG